MSVKNIGRRASKAIPYQYVRHQYAGGQGYKILGAADHRRPGAGEAESGLGVVLTTRQTYTRPALVFDIDQPRWEIAIAEFQHRRVFRSDREESKARRVRRGRVLVFVPAPRLGGERVLF